ncbi:MAG: hypothetical protein M1537_04010 [Nitrospirae bacterium]|nr:hypothetical protein [Nitrospirota bacterium]MCL5285863.1 hypothetical protein [Nitrospirota bacterium]
MKNPGNLARRNLWNAGTRVKSAELFYSRGEWSDVVRECREALDFTFKSLLYAQGLEINRFQNPGEIFSKERHRLPPSLQADWDRVERIAAPVPSSGADLSPPLGSGDFMTFGEEPYPSPTPEVPSSESAHSALSDARYMLEFARTVCRHLHGVQGKTP